MNYKIGFCCRDTVSDQYQVLYNQIIRYFGTILSTLEYISRSAT
eukprot:SAG31_NODE_3985_length_3685_cov_2.692694_1_plen_44_part_00